MARTAGTGRAGVGGSAAADCRRRHCSSLSARGRSLSGDKDNDGEKCREGEGELDEERWRADELEGENNGEGK